MDAKGVRHMYSILVVVNKHNTARVAYCWFIIYYRLVMYANSSIKFNDELSLSSFFVHLNAALLLRSREVPVSSLSPGTVYLKLASFVIFARLSLYVQRQFPKLTTSTAMSLPRTGYEGLRGGVEIYLYSFFNLGARWCGCSTPRPGRFTPGKKDPVPIVQETGWDPGSVWTGAENLAHHPDSIPGPFSP